MPDDPANKFDLIEYSTCLQHFTLFTLSPAFRIFNGASCISMVVTLRSFDHDTRFLTLSHMFDGAPKPMWNLRITQCHFEWLLTIEEHFARINLVISINFAICADSWSSEASIVMPVLLKSLSLANLSIFSNDVDFNSANVLIEHSLLFLFLSSGFT